MTRLYCPEGLSENQVLTLTQAQTHYLRHVLRAAVGHPLIMFNEQDGEWTSILGTLSKTTATVTVEEQLRPACIGPDISLLFAPIKHDPLTFLIEKATEMGVRHFHPVITERCNISRINQERLKGNVVEAAQQCERFDVPVIYPLMALYKALASWDASMPLLVCQERGDVPSLAYMLKSLRPGAPVGFLIGPEGGFSSQEITYLKSFSFTRFVGLGPRILRAETAALAALVCYQALAGDW